MWLAVVSASSTGNTLDHKYSCLDSGQRNQTQEPCKDYSEDIWTFSTGSIFCH